MTIKMGSVVLLARLSSCLAGLLADLTLLARGCFRAWLPDGSPFEDSPPPPGEAPDEGSFED